MSGRAPVCDCNVCKAVRAGYISSRTSRVPSVRPHPEIDERDPKVVEAQRRQREDGNE